MTHVDGTTPYSWPYDGHLDPARTALVVCGANAGLVGASTDPSTAAGVIAELCGRLTHLALRVAVGHLGQRGPLADPGPALDLGVPIIHAAGWDGRFASPLEAHLRRARVGSVLLAGWASELTVDSTVRTLNDRGFECLVITDACAPVDPDLGAHALHSLTMSGGIFGALGTSAAVLAALAPSTEPRELETR